MTVRIAIRARLYVSGITEAERQQLAALATFVNPQYESSKRYSKTGRPARGVEPDIRLHERPAQDPTAIILPRGLLSEVRPLFPDAVLDDLTVCPAVDLQTSGALVPRDVQAAGCDDLVAYRSGVLQAGTGQGKTIIALRLAEMLRTPTLILVHKAILLDQTAERIREFLGVEPGIIGEGKWEPRTVTVAMLQTLASPKRANDLAAMRDRWGLVVTDECQHVPAVTFAKVAQSFAARYRVGLTATPKRSDGLESILWAVIGPIVHVIPGRSLPLRWTRIETGWTVEDKDLPRCKVAYLTDADLTLDGQPDREPPVDTVALLNRLCDDKARTAFVADKIATLHTGTSLVVTERVNHARALAEALRARGLRAVAVASEVTKTGTGRRVKTKRTAIDPRERQEAIDALGSGAIDVLVSTPGMVGEGFDCPRIDTVCIAAPFGDQARAEQVAGRGTRPFEDKAFGRVVDFVDEGCAPLLAQWWRRFRVWKQLARVD
jgi:superfamily II DNA or RNA helicase